MRHIHSFKQFLLETFLPKNIEKREEVFDRMVKQKEDSGEIFVDHRPREIKILRQEASLAEAEITKRNPFSSSIVFKEKNNPYITGEFVFYLHAEFVEDRKRNNYEPYKLDYVEILYRKRGDKIKIILDENLEKLIENACKLIYEFNDEPNKIEKYKNLSKDVIKMGLEKGIFLQ